MSWLRKRATVFTSTDSTEVARPTVRFLAPDLNGQNQPLARRDQPSVSRHSGRALPCRRPGPVDEPHEQIYASVLLPVLQLDGSCTERCSDQGPSRISRSLVSRYRGFRVKRDPVFFSDIFKRRLQRLYG